MSDGLADRVEGTMRQPAMKGFTGDTETTPTELPRRSTRKRDALPRGLFVHPASGHKATVYGIRYICGAGHVHQEQAGALKSEALRRYHVRRARVHDEPGWCPRAERRHERERLDAERAREARRITFADYARDYLAWARGHKRSWPKDQSRLNSALLPALGGRTLDTITTAEIERLLNGLMDGRTPATVNRFRDQLSGMFKRAVRLGLVSGNPVTGIPKLRESSGRVVYLTPEDERALHDALPEVLRPMMTVAIYTGLRWSEQARLQWAHVDMLAGVLSVPLSKNGRSRRVPVNAAARAALLDVGAGRQHPGDPGEPVFGISYRHAVRLFGKAVARARQALTDQGGDASRLDGFTWHGLRHTFASRLVMNGVDLLTVKELGGWLTLAMVQRYAHLAPEHLRAAVEGLVRGPGEGKQLRENFESRGSLPATEPAGVS